MKTTTFVVNWEPSITNKTPYGGTGDLNAKVGNDKISLKHNV